MTSEDRIRELEARLARLERPSDRVGDRIQDVIRGVVPDETRGHIRAAWREQLLAARSFIDHWIGRTSADQATATIDK